MEKDKNTSASYRSHLGELSEHRIQDDENIKLWQYFSDPADTLKDKLWTIATWLLARPVDCWPSPSLRSSSSFLRRACRPGSLCQPWPSPAPGSWSVSSASRSLTTMAGTSSETGIRPAFSRQEHAVGGDSKAVNKKNGG